MGLIGLLVVVLVGILSAGYFLFDAPGKTISIENPSREKETGMEVLPNVQENISRYESVRNQATDVKSMIENRAAETMKEFEEPILLKETEKKESAKIDILSKKADFGYGIPEKKRVIDTIVLHSSYNPDGSEPYSIEKVFRIWKGYDVAPHYMIDRKGNIYRLVDDANIAYHAGASKMPDGRQNVNDFSIGIEILNTKEDRYTKEQYGAINDLVAYLKGKYEIKNIVGHADIAPDRKDDPWNFDWKQLK